MIPIYPFGLSWNYMNLNGFERKTRNFNGFIWIWMNANDIIWVRKTVFISIQLHEIVFLLKLYEHLIDYNQIIWELSNFKENQWDSKGALDKNCAIGSTGAKMITYAMRKLCAQHTLDTPTHFGDWQWPHAYSAYSNHLWYKFKLFRYLFTVM